MRLRLPCFASCNTCNGSTRGMTACILMPFSYLFESAGLFWVEPPNQSVTAAGARLGFSKPTLMTAASLGHEVCTVVGYFFPLPNAPNSGHQQCRFNTCVPEEDQRQTWIGTHNYTSSSYPIFHELAQHACSRDKYVISIVVRSAESWYVWQNLFLNLLFSCMWPPVVCGHHDCFQFPTL